MYQSDSAPWLWFRAWNTDGTAKTDLVYNTSGISIKVARDNQADSSALTLSAASSPTDWAAGKFLQVVGNLYKVGIATASISSYTGAIAICGSYTGGTIEGVLDHVSAYNPAGNPNTTAPATPTNVSDVQAAILAKLPSALVGGRIDASVGSYQTGLTPLQPLVAGRQISVAATTGAVELDSAARVKLDASQPDYAPATAAALATAYAVIQLTDTDVSAIEARLPSDPADQSAVEAAITAATSPLATSSALSTAAVNITTILGKFTGITFLSRWLGALAGKTADTTTRAEINATTAGAGYNETTDSQEAIRDRGDSAWITGSGGGGGGTTTIVTLQAAAGISPGVIVGPSEPLVIGDDYLTVMNRSVRINLLDANGDPAEVEYGTYALDDAGISIQMLLAKSGKPSVEALIVGTCTFFPAVGDVPPYLIVEFTKVETAKAIPGPYDMQVEAVWNDGKTVTFAPYGQIEFTRNIGRRT